MNQLVKDDILGDPSIVEGLEYLDIEDIKELIEEKAEVFRYIEQKYKEDRELIKEFVKLNSLVYTYLPKEIKDDDEFVLELIVINMDLLTLVDEYIQKKIEEISQYQITTNFCIVSTPAERLEMLQKVRVYEIAVETGLSSSDVMKKALDLGIKLSSPQEQVTIDKAEEIVTYIQTGNKTQSCIYFIYEDIKYLNFTDDKNHFIYGKDKNPIAVSLRSARSFEVNLDTTSSTQTDGFLALWRSKKASLVKQSIYISKDEKYYLLTKNDTLLLNRIDSDDKAMEFEYGKFFIEDGDDRTIYLKDGVLTIYSIANQEDIATIKIENVDIKIVDFDMEQKRAIFCDNKEAIIYLYDLEKKDIIATYMFAKDGRFLAYNKNGEYVTNDESLVSFQDNKGNALAQEHLVYKLKKTKNLLKV